MTAAVLPTPAAKSSARPTALVWLQKLYVQVLIGVVLGTLLGLCAPQVAVVVKPMGDLFIKAIKMVVTPIIFLTIVVGIATIGDMRKVAGIGLRALIYFEVASTIALLFSVAIGNLWPVGEGINANPATLDAGALQGIVGKAHEGKTLDFLMGIVPSTFVAPFASGDILPVLFVAVLFGLGLCKAGERAKPLVSLLEQASAGLFGMVSLIMRLAPLGAFGAMAFTVGEYGIATLMSLGELLVLVYVVSALFVVLVLGTFLRLAGFRLLKVLAHFKEELLVVFAATAAETMIPRSMEKLTDLGVRREAAGLVMPTGFSFNMDGTAIYITAGALFIAHATNTHLSLGQQATILLTMLLTSKGAAGFSGGGLITLAATLPTVGVLPVAGLTLLIGVDRFMAQVRAVTNLASNIIATLVVGRWVGAVDMQQATAILDHKRGATAEGSASGPGGPA